MLNKLTTFEGVMNGIKGKTNVIMARPSISKKRKAPTLGKAKTFKKRSIMFKVKKGEKKNISKENCSIATSLDIGKGVVLNSFHRFM